jgi:hypothetical protein
VECRSATDEAVPPGGAVPDTWPTFVAIVMAHLPPRDDYHLSSAYGLCEGTSGQAGRMVMSFGEGEEHGQFVVELFPDFYQVLPSASATCATLAAQSQEVFFCTDATATEPLAFGGRDQRGGVYALTLYPDGRSIVFEDTNTNLAPETMRTIVSDPSLAALLA